jgi:hypothetical protein
VGDVFRQGLSCNPGTGLGVNSVCGGDWFSYG